MEPNPLHKKKSRLSKRRVGVVRERGGCGQKERIVVVEFIHSFCLVQHKD